MSPKRYRRKRVYADYYDSIQRSIVERYYAMVAEEHYHAPNIRSLLTEELIRSELLPRLPEGLHISKGEVKKGTSSSGDCDLIIYKRSVLFWYGSVCTVPYESAKAIIEIKICARDLIKEVEKLKEYRDYAEKVFAIAMHGHFKRSPYERKKAAIEERYGIGILP